jgi:hypothetical protein
MQTWFGFRSDSYVKQGGTTGARRHRDRPQGAFGFNTGQGACEAIGPMMGGMLLLVLAPLIRSQ